MALSVEYSAKGDPKVAETILRSLPEWFGIEESTKTYIEESKTLPMIIAKENNEAVGFISLKIHSEYTAEIYVMGVLPTYHRQGIATKLLSKAENELKKRRVEFLQVKTISPHHESQHYHISRLFYKSNRFREVEVFPTLWGPSNPCLLMIKELRNVEKD